jgi:cytochrome c biogenesis protein CcmG/thiol:disulfide interchange protein DsbE
VSRLIVFLALLLGFVAGAGVIGGLLLLGPAAAPVVGAPSASSAAGASPSPSPSPSPSASPSPGGSPLQPSASPSSAFRVGQKAPALALQQVGGGTVDLATFLGRPVWVNFTGTNYPASRDDFPIMQRLADKYRSEGLSVLAVTREDEATVRAFLAAVGTSFPVLLDADGSAEARWGAFAKPIHFWIDRGGTIRGGALGQLGPDVMSARLQSILPGVTVSP